MFLCALILYFLDNGAEDLLAHSMEFIMEPILSGIIAALVAGATAKAKDVASDAVKTAYESLKSMIVQKLGKTGAVQSVEDDPESESAQTTLAQALATTNLHTDTELQVRAAQVEEAIKKWRVDGTPGSSDIDIALVRGRVNALVEDLVAKGCIRVGPVISDGDAIVRGLKAGS